MSQKPSLPKGTRDFGPEQMAKRNYILNTIRGVFEIYGFMPIETPAMENLSTLTGKYGDEGDKLLYRILDSGDYLKELKRINDKNNDIQVQEAIRNILKQFCIELNTSQETLSLQFIKDQYDDKINGLILSESSYIDSHEYLELFFEAKQDIISSLVNRHFFYSSKSVPSDKIEPQNFDFHFQQFVNEDLNTIIIPDYFDFILVYKIKNEQYNITNSLASKGLKYDLTVPFARYVVMNRHELALPFKRYQIQPVWRADRPQKGRYREFFQCDADVIGTNSLVCEAEIIMMMNTTLAKLKIDDYTVKINNRKILTGITEAIGAPGKESDFCVAIDKLDKIGLEKVLEELRERGLSNDSINKVVPILELKGNLTEKINYLKDILKDSETGLKGLQEIEQTIEYVETMDGDLSKVSFDITLARGLSYYTGAIFEIAVNNVKIGSISGGGRYDDLTGVFGMPDMSGVGFSFGVDRLYDVMEELNLFPASSLTSTNVLIIHFDEASKNYGLGVATALRKSGIKSEIYPDQAKIKKQFAYADKKNIPYTIIIGSEEIASNQLTLRNMVSGEEEKLEINQIIQKLKN